MKVVLWDLDSTLCNTMHRQPMVAAIRASNNTGPTWEDYSLACIDDEPIEGAIALARLISTSTYTDAGGKQQHYRQLGVSGRSRCAEAATWAWLVHHQVPLDDVILREDGDRTENGLFKAGVIEKLREQLVEVSLYVEDWKETADVIREKTGVPVLLVKGEYIEDTSGTQSL